MKRASKRLSTTVSVSTVLDKATKSQKTSSTRTPAPDSGLIFSKSTSKSSKTSTKMNFGSEKPVFIYFKGAGRATAARVALFNAFGENGWENKMLPYQEFADQKAIWQKSLDAPNVINADGTKQVKDEETGDMKSVKNDYGGSLLQTPLGYLPQLHFGGKIITQSAAIARWAAGLGEKPLMPKDHFERLECEVWKCQNRN